MPFQKKFGGITIRQVEQREERPAFRSAIEEYQYNHSPYRSISPTGMVQIVPYCLREGQGEMIRCQQCGEEVSALEARKWWHSTGLCARRRLDSPAIPSSQEAHGGDETTQDAASKPKRNRSSKPGGKRRRRTRPKSKPVRRKR